MAPRNRSYAPSPFIPYMRRAHTLTLAAVTATAATVTLACRPSRTMNARTPPIVAANDNRVSAGRMRGDTLELKLEVRMGRWYPEAEDGAYLDVPVLAEEGKPPQIPAPLVRVRTGTVIAATIRNTLADSTVWVRGLATRPAAAVDSVGVEPGGSRTIRFRAGEPGTYLYTGAVGRVNWDVVEREQLAGAFVVDSSSGRTDDRVLVINIWGEPKDSLTYRNALTINGKAWPHTERVAAAVGDSIRWRVVNASIRPHPMHLHGFYYRIDALGTDARDSALPPAARPLVVTHTMPERSTMSMVWSPDRAGNWLFHCHIGFHVVPDARLDPAERHRLSHDPGEHMAGLVLGASVSPAPGSAEPARANARSLRLYVQEGRPRGRAKRAMGFVLQRGSSPPAADSIEISGSPLMLTRGQPTDITVINRLREHNAIHWHGIELESYSDGVAGWSGMANRLAPSIAPGDSFVARLTLPRAGTFMYHTHMNDLEQLTSGLYGPIVVLEPGQRFDPRTDHVYTVGWDGGEDPPYILVNGDSLSAPVEFAAGVKHRFRFINIGAAAVVTARLTRASGVDSSVVRWRRVAKDGAELPAAQAIEGPAQIRLDVGETGDVEWTPVGSGEYLLTIGVSAKLRRWRQRIRVQ